MRGELAYQRRSRPAAGVRVLTAPEPSCIDLRSAQPLFDPHSGRKQHVVLQMHVPMQIALELQEFGLQEFGHGDGVGRAAIGRRGVAACQLANDAPRATHLLVLPLHHSDRVCDVQRGDGSDLLYTVVAGRVKLFKTTPRGTDVILELFGPGDPIGAVAVYESRPYPASALALVPVSCLVIPRQAFFSACRWPML
jgi:CRP-like cAMP-binding protein